ncbi:MAG: hypothetical protein J7K40_09780, partial [candidate division Zixibacteria bacterium]|nr:hypothetical protein [candidate division Zixibacteria bacterium]
MMLSKSSYKKINLQLIIIFSLAFFSILFGSEQAFGDAPILDAIGAQNVDEGNHLEFVVTSSDVDLDPLTLTAENMPTNAAFYDSSNGHGLFEFDPDYTQSGVYQVRFIVSDGALADTELVDITVNHVNIAP